MTEQKININTLTTALAIVEESELLEFYKDVVLSMALNINSLDFIQAINSANRLKKERRNTGNRRKQRNYERNIRKKT